MSGGGEDPEALLAQALRAKAGQGGPNVEPPGAAGTAIAHPGDIPAAAQVPVLWVLLLALVLGLATGAVIGLLTLL